MAKLIMRLFAFDLIVFSLNIIITISEFPMKTKMLIIAEDIETNILTTLCIISLLRLSSYSSYSMITVANCKL